ncbi:EGF-like domain [Trinorchestia longiramus]|nr:EGF-like domain [Trinorchestia longiramus]
MWRAAVCVCLAGRVQSATSASMSARLQTAADTANASKENADAPWDSRENFARKWSVPSCVRARVTMWRAAVCVCQAGRVQSATSASMSARLQTAADTANASKENADAPWDSRENFARKKGWRDVDCAKMDDAALQCLPDCSLHGHFDLESQECVCDPEWSGSECDKRVCGLDCGQHGRCEGSQCICSDGWTGEKCDLRTCDVRCEEHGQCKNGTCVCMTGWNGRHCTLPGCPSACSGHGTCVLKEDDWSCDCHQQWEGLDCGIRLETECGDGVDNDQDGLTDCEDSECCSSSPCARSNHCYSSHDPIDILLRKQPPAVTASFFQKMRFIVEEGSLQTYAKQAAFNQRSVYEYPF